MKSTDPAAASISPPSRSQVGNHAACARSIRAAKCLRLYPAFESIPTLLPSSKRILPALFRMSPVQLLREGIESGLALAMVKGKGRWVPHTHGGFLKPVPVARSIGVTFRRML